MRANRSHDHSPEATRLLQSLEEQLPARSTQVTTLWIQLFHPVLAEVLLVSLRWSFGFCSFAWQQTNQQLQTQTSQITDACDDRIKSSGDKDL